MKPLLIIFFVALSVTAVSTPAVRRLALGLGFLDLPSRRKVHKEPVPLMGGMAILGGAVVAFLVLVSEFNVTRRVVGVVVGMTLMALIGLLDDRKDLPFRLKLVLQILLVFLLGYLDIRIRLPVPEFLNHVLAVVWIVGITNAINFTDNMDGLCAGVCSVAAAFVVLLAVLNGQVLVSALGAAVLGSCLGFLRYNFSPATILMGDAGSLFLGFVLAVLGILLRFPENVNIVTWMVPIFILGLPIFDTILVFISRLRRGVNPFTTAGLDHTSHRLLKAGFTSRETVLILYLVSVGFGLLGVWIAQAEALQAYVVATLTAGLGLLAIHRLEKIHRNGSSQSSRP